MTTEIIIGVLSVPGLALSAWTLRAFAAARASAPADEQIAALVRAAYGRGEQS